MTLEDDIARIAALRGRPAESYLHPVPLAPVKSAAFNLLWSMDADTAADLEALDRLPERSRELLTNSPRPMNARVWRSILDSRDGNEDFVLAQFRAIFGEPKAVVRKPRRRFS